MFTKPQCSELDKQKSAISCITFPILLCGSNEFYVCKYIVFTVSHPFGDLKMPLYEIIVTIIEYF